jgi:threonylcarbamoyladenosine tRNA methylthiotransferase MtaB
LEKGFKEIVLTGIHLGSYGKGLDIKLHHLLEDLLKIDGDYRIRLGSIDPHEFDNELVNIVINNERICQYFHIPLQSGSNRVLARMNRRYDLKTYSNLVKLLRNKNPLVGIGTDLIVGFPGETDDDFNKTVDFVTDQAFSRMHIFRYSPRQGTPAARFPNRIPATIQEERSHHIQSIAICSAISFGKKFTGRTVNVLFEEQDLSGWSGLSGEYLRVKVESNTPLRNILTNVRIIGNEGNELLATY